MPVPCADVATVISRYTAAVDNDSENDEARACSDFDHTEDELHFAIAANAKDLDDREDSQEDSDPDSNVVVMPEVNSDAGGRNFKR